MILSHIWKPLFPAQLLSEVTKKMRPDYCRPHLFHVYQALFSLSCEKKHGRHHQAIKSIKAVCHRAVPWPTELGMSKGKPKEGYCQPQHYNCSIFNNHCFHIISSLNPNPPSQTPIDSVWSFPGGFRPFFSFIISIIFSNGFESFLRFFKYRVFRTF